jgi:acetylornithine aminotransferase
MFDEVQSGLGRTGEWFAAHKQGVLADVITLAKPLGSGLPIGACLVNAKANLISPGKHGTTFGGNPLCTAAALTFLEVMEKDNLLKNVQKQSVLLVDGIKNIFNSDTYQIRAKGLMIGIEVELKDDFLKQAILTLPTKALEIGLLINVTGGNVIRILPPFIINSKEVEILLKKLQSLKESFLV